MALPTPTSGKDPDPAAAALVGRSAERQRIDHALDQLIGTHTPAIVEVVGEPGIGKSTLLRVLARAAEDRGAQVFTGRATELAGDVPFAMFVDAFDDYLGGLERRHVQRLLDEDGDGLASVFPALAAGARSAPGPADGERFRRHRAVRGLLERIATRQPAVLVLDDVHWADAASVELIAALLRNPPDAPGLMALAYRPRQMPARLAAELEAAAAAGLVERIEVGPLSRDEAAQLLGDRAAGDGSIYAASGGNPFYLEELARAGGRSASPAPRGPHGDLEVPAAVSAALYAELEALPSEARTLATAAAVAGDPFDADLAAEIADLPHAAALDVLDVLLEADLVRISDVPRSFAFRHPLVRRAVYDSGRPGWRLGAHARADAALARRGASPASRAHHVEQSAAPGDEAAVDLLVAAAAAAPTPVIAARWLRSAVRLAPESGPRRAQILPFLGRALALSGSFEEGHSALVEALELIPPEAIDLRTSLTVACARIERLLGRLEEARGRLVRAARAVDHPGSPAAVSLAIELGAASLYSADLPAMESASSTALEQATALGDDALIAGASAVRAASRFHHGDFPAARDLADAAADLVRGADTSAAPVAWLDTLFHLGMSGVFMERYSRAAGHLGQALDIARATGAEQLYVESAAGRAAALAELGLLADARESADAAVDAARLSNNPQKLAWGLMARATVATAEGALDGALRDGAEAVEIARTVEAPTIASGVATAAAGTLIEAGDHAAAVEVLTGLQGGEGLELVFPTRHALACRLLTRAELGRADLAAARAWAERAAAYAAQNDLAMPSAHAALADAAVLLAEGEPDGAAERAEHAVSLCESVGAVLEAARAQLLAGQALAAAGDRERAGDHLRSAEAAFTRIGAGRLRDQTVRELRAIGRRVARAGRRGDLAAGGLAALSGREREVADLVRDRLTNRQIGAELFLSEKTVETHLRNVFVKLGVDSRVAVARMLEEAAAP